MVNTCASLNGVRKIAEMLLGRDHRGALTSAGLTLAALTLCAAACAAPPSPPISVGDRVVVSSASIEVRSGPLDTADVVGERPLGATGTVTAETTDAAGVLWQKITFATGEDGWVKQGGASRASPLGAAPTTGSRAAASADRGSKIVAKSGQVIENLRISSRDGDCIYIPPGVSDVTIRNNEIGPCMTKDGKPARGIFSVDGTTRITVIGNVLHDVSTAAFFYKSAHPIEFSKNTVYNIRGPFPQGQMVQFHSVLSGTQGSKVLCNISDQEGSLSNEVADHISMYLSRGLPEAPTEIAYNRIRGGSNKSGSAIQAADGGGGYVWVHDNTAVNVGGNGTPLSSGTHVRIERNRIFSDGIATKSGAGLHVRNDYEGKAECSNNVVTGNRVFTINSAWHKSPKREALYQKPGSCKDTVVDDNKLDDSSLSAAILDEEYPECR